MKHTFILRLVGIALVVGIGGMSGCSDDDSGPTAPPPQGTLNKKIVLMKDNVFDPRDVTIARGDTIVWFNAGSAPHTTTSGDGVPDGLWDSGSDPGTWMAPGAQFQRIFDDTTGTFMYYCVPHFSVNMKGTVTVNP